MSALEPSPVAAEPLVQFPAVGPGNSEQLQLYEVQTAAPERIEAVTMRIVYNEALDDNWILRLIDATGVSVFAQCTPHWDLD